MENIQNVIAEFAKTNKVSRSKLEAFIQQQVIPNVQVKQQQAKQGRKLMDKTAVLHKRILNAINFGFSTSSDIRYILGNVDKITLNNALIYLEKTGRISKGNIVHTGKKGRQPFSWKVATQG